MTGPFFFFPPPIAVAGHSKNTASCRIGPNGPLFHFSCLFPALDGNGRGKKRLFGEPGPLRRLVFFFFLHTLFTCGHSGFVAGKR